MRSRLLAGVVCTALAGIACSAVVGWLPGSSARLPGMFGAAAETGGGPAAVHAAALAPSVVAGAVSATVGPADGPMPHEGTAVDVRDEMLGAYQTAASLAPVTCGLDVSLLAAIGQVESGNLADHRLDAHHRPEPAVLGPLLDGSDGLTAVPDTDGGEWDGDTTWDRAVGPMQFVPDAWRLSGVDFDADGERNPQDVEDSAGAAMVFLCAGGDDLATRAGLRSAISAFNTAPSYVGLVLAWKTAFANLDRAEVEPLELTAVQYERISRELADSSARTADALDPSSAEATPQQDPTRPGDPTDGPTPTAPGAPPWPWAVPPVVAPAPGGGGSSSTSPVQPAPVQPPPASAEPSPVGPGPARAGDPTPTDPPSEPKPSDPTPSEPAPSEPKPSDPEPSEPEPSESPRPAEPTPSDPEPSTPPEPSDPTPSQPEPSQPAPSDPASSDPAPSDPEPTPSEPAPSDPAPSTSASAEPSSAPQPSALPAPE